MGDQRPRQTRGRGRQYFYLNRRLPDGRIRKQYFGKGMLAEIESLRLEKKVEARRQLNAEHQRTAAAESLLRQHLRSTRDVTHALMLSIGYTNERYRGWRPLPMIAQQKASHEAANAPAEDNELSFEELVKAARQGDRSVIPALRKIMWANPELARCNGELAARTRIQWINLIAGSDLHYRQCLLLKVAELRRELIAETSGTAVEEMIVDQAVSTWLQLYYHEDREATAPAQNLRVGEYRLRKLESAFNRHMRSLNALASMRAISFTKRMAETMQAAVTDRDSDQRKSLPKTASHATCNRIRGALSRSLESVAMN